MPLQVTSEHCKQSIDQVDIQTSSRKILKAWVSVRPNLAPQQFRTLTDNKQIAYLTCADPSRSVHSTVGCVHGIS